MKAVRVGAVVPPANPTVEPELHRLLPVGVHGYVARLRVSAGLELRERLASYRDGFGECVCQLRGLDPAAVLMACTGSCYPLGPDGDRAWSAAMSADYGVPVITAAGAVLLALRWLRAETISLISPYPAWLTQQSANFWQAAGIGVVVHQMAGSGSVYDTYSNNVYAAIRRAADDVQAVVVAGTGAPTVAAIEELATGSPVPLVSSNLAGCWALLRAAGCAELLAETSSPALQRLVRDTSHTPVGNRATW